MVSDFKTVTVIGLGMIGGSVVKALKTQGYRGQVFGMDHDEKTVHQAFLEGCINNSKVDEKALIEQSDVVVLATPIQYYPEILESIREHLKASCIVTDVGSVKGTVHQMAIKLLDGKATFIGGHPMIGSEKTGFKAAKAHLFENAYYFLTSEPGQESALDELREWVELLGAKVCVVSPDEHDRIVARTSHIPHLNAVLLVHLLNQNHLSLIDYVGGGFRDTTRIASGNPEMWTEIFINNKSEVLSAIDGFVQQLEQFKKNLMEENKTEIVYNLSKAKQTREQIPKHLIDSIEPEYALFIDVQDKPGMIAAVAGMMAEHTLNIKDIEILHARETVPGVLKVGFYSKEERQEAKRILETSEFGKDHTIENGSDMH